MVIYNLLPIYRKRLKIQIIEREKKGEKNAEYTYVYYSLLVVRAVVPKSET